MADMIIGWLPWIALRGPTSRATYRHLPRTPTVERARRVTPLGSEHHRTCRAMAHVARVAASRVTRSPEPLRPTRLAYPAGSAHCCLFPSPNGAIALPSALSGHSTQGRPRVNRLALHLRRARVPLVGCQRSAPREVRTRHTGRQRRPREQSRASGAPGTGAWRWTTTPASPASSSTGMPSSLWRRGLPEVGRGRLDGCSEGAGLPSGHGRAPLAAPGPAGR